MIAVFVFIVVTTARLFVRKVEEMIKIQYDETLHPVCAKHDNFR
jgi:hypothetical protein